MTDIRLFGAVGDGRTKCTAAFAEAVRACRQSKDTLLVPAGDYLTGTVNLMGVSMHLEAGARIIASSDPYDYPPQAFVHNEMGALTALIVSLEGENQTIDGSGTIDLRGSAFYDFTRPIIPETRVPMNEEEIACCTVEHDWRPGQSVFFRNIKGLTVRGITILDAPCWTLAVTSCENVTLSDLFIRTNLNVPNDDGIHICSSRGVVISRCHIESGDDCIALSGITDWDRPCENIVISDCVLMSCSKAIVIGYQFSHIRNVLISNVIIRDSNRGLCFMCDDDGGLVEHVKASNMLIDTAIRPGNWWGNGEAILMEALPSAAIIPKEQKPCRATPVNYRDIVLENISCTTENAIGAIGTGSNYENVVFRNVSVQMKEAKYMHLKGHAFDAAPASDVYEIPEDCAIYINGADVQLENTIAAPFRGKEQTTVKV